ncbi:MAG: hypothetical protein ACK5OB_08370 [Pirellula sp.]
MSKLLGWFAFVWLLFGTCWGQSPAQRYALGRRLQRFERAWQTADYDRRLATTPTMEKAVGSFFSLQIAQANQLLDEAWMIASGVPEDERRIRQPWNAYYVDVEVPVIDADAKRMRMRLLTSYPDPQTDGASDASAAADAPSSAAALPGRWMRWGEAGSGTRTESLGTWDHPRSSEWIDVSVAALPLGEHRLKASFQHDDGKPFDWIAESICIVRNAERLQQDVNKWLEDHRGNRPDTLWMTSKLIAKEWSRALQGQPMEIDPPWDTWLAHWETLSSSDASLKPLVSGAGTGQCWLDLATDAGHQVVRVWVPAAKLSSASAPGGVPASRPVVFAFHGAGGSENMFFETYGAGRLIELAKEHGWIVVAPRQNLLAGKLALNVGPMLDELSGLIPIDRQRVGLIGHSMGAAQAITQVSSDPTQVTAVVAIGGGGRANRSAELQRVPFWIAAGARDFGKSGAKALADRLSDSGCAVEYREYPDIEHMVIVQASLDDATEFLLKAFEKAPGRSIQDR